MLSVLWGAVLSGGVGLYIKLGGCEVSMVGVVKVACWGPG